MSDGMSDGYRMEREARAREKRPTPTAAVSGDNALPPLWRAVEDWCLATNAHRLAADQHDILRDREHAAAALLPEIKYGDGGEPLPDAWKDHGPHNSAWVAWAEVHDQLSAARDRLKVAVERYNAAHRMLFKLAGLTPVDDVPLDHVEEENQK